MLAELTVRNLAVIEETRLAFGPGLNVITGETGAGKSLLVDALAFVLGGAADRGMMRRGADSTGVEAVFDVSEPHVQQALVELGVEVDEEDEVAVLYREVHKKGRTVSRLNGRAVPVSMLRAVGGVLVDIHGQGSHLSLLDPRFQMRVLDDFCVLGEQRSAVERAVAEARRLQSELDDAEAAIRDAEQRRDLLAFQVDEIETAAPLDGEEEALLRERHVLEHAESVRDACAAAWDALSEGDRNAADLAAEALDHLRRAPGAAEALGAQVEALESAVAQLGDVAREVRRLAESVESDPARLEEIEERVELLRRLKRKYGGSESAVLAFAEDARAQLERIETAGERREELKRALDQASGHAGALAYQLSEARQQAAAALGEAVAAELREVGLERASFDIAVERDEAEDGLPAPDGRRYAFSPGGIDRVTFAARTNPGEESRPLAKVASGGETSRMMLALNSALQTASGAPSVVFDEIDAGIGSRAGEVVGRKLWTVGRRAQVLCVTHLPQIAAWADTHFRVGKAVQDGRTYSGAEPLSDRGRAEELAGMLGAGATVARAAQEMLERAAKEKGVPSPGGEGNAL
ncbi:MAG: DNA repair protein RecN [Chloroflexi bacterium]|nr:DNA repair protein RecN [Chloroflexota bacterium]